MLDRMSTPARWRAVDKHGFVLDILLQHHRDTEATKIFLIKLLGEYDVLEVIHTDQLRSYGAVIREIPSLINVDHQQVISTAHCNNMIEQRASVASRAVLPKTISPSHQGVKSDSSLDSSGGNGRRRFSACTPKSRIFTVIPAPAFPL